MRKKTFRFIQVKAICFSSDNGPTLHWVRVSADNNIRVWDEIGEIYTSCHILDSPSLVAQIIKDAR